MNYTKLFIEDLLLSLRIGFADWEKHPDKKWRIKVSCELTLDRANWQNARYEDLVDYDRIHSYVLSWQDRPHIEFIETLAEDLVSFCLQDPRVQACRAVVKKLDVYPQAAHVGIELYRERT